MNISSELMDQIYGKETADNTAKTARRDYPSNPIPNSEIPQKLPLSSLVKVFQLFDHTGELSD